MHGSPCRRQGTNSPSPRVLPATPCGGDTCPGWDFVRARRTADDAATGEANTGRPGGTDRLRPGLATGACDRIRRLALASGQAVRRLTLDQEIEGSNPSSPATLPPRQPRCRRSQPRCRRSQPRCRRGQPRCRRSQPRCRRSQPRCRRGPATLPPGLSHAAAGALVLRDVHGQIAVQGGRPPCPAEGACTRSRRRIRCADPAGCARVEPYVRPAVVRGATACSRSDRGPGQPPGVVAGRARGGPSGAASTAPPPSRHFRGSAWPAPMRHRVPRAHNLQDSGRSGEWGGQVSVTAR